MEFCVCSDLHLGKYKNSYGRDRLADGLNALEVVFATAARLDKVILMAGDLFNIVPLNPDVINQTLKFFLRMNQQYPGVVMYGISGNHDISVNFTPEQQGVTALTAISETCPNFILMDHRVHTFSGGITLVGIPYYKYKEHFRTILESCTMDQGIRATAKAYLLTHQTPEGIIDLEVDFSPNDPILNPFSRVFNGHIHHHKDLGKVISVGNHAHLDKSDVDKEVGFLIYNTDTDTYTREILSNQFPQFIVRPEGAELNEWEKQQMVIYETSMLDSNVSGSEKFSSSVSPQDITETYIAEANVDEAMARVGRSIVNRLNS